MSFYNLLNTNYNHYLETKIIHRRFSYNDFLTVINQYKNNEIIDFSVLGKSVENRNIHLLKLGNGKQKIMLWSQMHGNEPTATLALLDIFKFFTLNDDLNDPFKNNILDHCTLYFIPLVNPDGAERFTRRNALGIDLNRDARSLSAPESQLLKQFRDKTNADIGFNLHDQELYYGIGDSRKPSTMAFLAPSYNFKKDINEKRKRSMKIIVSMKKALENFIPQQIGLYSDAFMPNAFGDSMQKWGTSTILIESGAFKNDYERQFVRKLNFIAILQALHEISNKSFEKNTIEEYHKIPLNKKDAIFDLLIRNIEYRLNNSKFEIDLGISRDKTNRDTFSDYIENQIIWDIGDLKDFSGFDEIKANGMYIKGEELELKLSQKADFNIYEGENIKFKIRNGKIINK